MNRAAVERLAGAKREGTSLALRTPICDLFGIDIPILLAGMGQAATPALAAAVSNAGGLGVLGATACSPMRLRRWIQETRELTDKPFGVDTILPASVRRAAGSKSGRTGHAPGELAPYQAFVREFMDREGLEMPDAAAMAREAGIAAEDSEGPQMLSQAFFEAQMEVVIEERVPVYAAGLGSPAPWMERLHANGTKVISIVGSVRHVASVLESGVDAIVAQGSDGGGHNAPIGTMALIPQVVERAGGVPVLGAGGIGSGQGVAAALMLGAQGAWLGTAFLATDESGVPEYQKKVLVGSDAASTTISRALSGKPVRLLRGKWVESFAESGLEALPMPWQSTIAAPALTAASLAERGDVNPGIAGQGVGMVRQIEPAADVLERIATEAEGCLRGAADWLE
jgi:NAD(P)H-dependent flavin oxidoreductase YrpB (nitropropane dioxygenase family)